MIASDQDSARAYAKTAAPDHRRAAGRRALRREGRVEEDHRVHRRATSAGWSRSGWSPRASTCPAWRSASTPPRPRPRCSSPRPSAASSAPAGRGETASVFLPSVPALLGFASEMEVERDHVLGRKVSDEGDIFAAENDLLAQANASEAASDELELSFEALGSEARFDRVLFDGGEFGHAGEVHVGSEEEMDFLGIPGLLEPDQMRELLHQRQSDRAKKQKAARPRRRAGRPSREVSHPRAAGGPAPRAQRPGRRLVPPHRPGPRHHPRRAAQGVRRPGGRRRRRPTSCTSAIDQLRDWAAREDLLDARGRAAPRLGACRPRPPRRSTAAPGARRAGRVPGRADASPSSPARLEVNRTVVYRLVSTLEQHALVRRTPRPAARRARRAAPRLRRAAGAARPGRPGAAAPRRAGRLHRAPHGRRRRRGAGAGGRRAVVDRLPRQLPGRLAAPAAPGCGRQGDPAGPRGRLRAYAVTAGELQAGARGLAAPVRGVEGLEASVGIVTLGELDVDAIGPVVAAAAADVGRAPADAPGSGQPAGRPAAGPGRAPGWPARSRSSSARSRARCEHPVDDPLQVGVGAGDHAAPHVAGAGDRVRLEHLGDRREVGADGVVPPPGSPRPAGSPGSGTRSPGSRAPRATAPGPQPVITPLAQLVEPGLDGAAGHARAAGTPRGRRCAARRRRARSICRRDRPWRLLSWTSCPVFRVLLHTLSCARQAGAMTDRPSTPPPAAP